MHRSHLTTYMKDSATIIVEEGPEIVEAGGVQVRRLSLGSSCDMNHALGGGPDDLATMTIWGIAISSQSKR